jgi:hypothetical protein
MVPMYSRSISTLFDLCQSKRKSCMCKLVDRRWKTTKVCRSYSFLDTCLFPVVDLGDEIINIRTQLIAKPRTFEQVPAEELDALRGRLEGVPCGVHPPVSL